MRDILISLWRFAIVAAVSFLHLLKSLAPGGSGFVS